MGPCTASSCCCQARNLPWAPCTASSCCCQVQSVSWVPVRPPIAAVSIATLCCPFRSPHTAGGFHFVIGCWQITGLPLLLPGPVICHGPLYRLLMLLPGPDLSWAPVPASSCCCCQVQSVSWVPVRPPIAAVSIATLCHVPLSGLLTLLVGSILS
ncbi:unnamed protein product [Staurois parvus]|uniref:Uncharacterized protein n=1 Tax=Staurois parvus TaxID=386267 RepID=A0ABN9FFV7_9NEOB|nr:unnamed protein product [Staurois parvus]